MIEEIPYLSLWGKDFSPRRATEMSGITMAHTNEPGEMGLRGRYRGLPLPFGAGVVEPPGTVAPTERLAWVMDVAAKHLASFRQLGASDCKLHVDIRYWDQCNLEFWPEEIAKLATLGVPLTMTCWDCTGQPEPANQSPGERSG